MKRFGDARDWFFDKRYGMFIHWGLYAINGFHEQEIFRRNVPRPEYIRLMERFDPSAFDANRWVDDVLSFGMEYVVLTAKHIDGFCLFDSAYTDFKSVSTPFGKDVVKLLADACCARGVPFGVYYAIPDMNYKNYPNHGRSYEYMAPQEGDRPDLDAYLLYVARQVTELCTNYGPLCAFFWDANVLGHRDDDLNELIRRLQPGCVINDRGFGAGDYGTPERDFERSKIENALGFASPTEACQSLGMESWGWRENEKYFSSRFLMQGMDKVLAKGGNYLLNIGPKPDGTFGEKERVILSRIGAWYRSVRPAFTGAQPSRIALKHEGAVLPVTVRENDVYVHFPSGFAGESVLLEGVYAMPGRVELLGTGQALSAERTTGVRNWFHKQEPVRICGIPAEDTYADVPVIRLSYSRLPECFAAADPCQMTEVGSAWTAQKDQGNGA